MDTMIRENCILMHISVYRWIWDWYFGLEARMFVETGRGKCNLLAGLPFTVPGRQFTLFINFCLCRKSLVHRSASFSGRWLIDGTEYCEFCISG